METSRLDREMNENQSIVIMVFTALAGAVACLWKASETRNGRAITQLEIRVDKCDEDRHHMRDELEASRVDRARIRARLDACEQCGGLSDDDDDDDE